MDEIYRRVQFSRVLQYSTEPLCAALLLRIGLKICVDNEMRKSSLPHSHIYYPEQFPIFTGERFLNSICADPPPKKNKYSKLSRQERGETPQ